MTPIFVQRQSGELAFERLYRTHVQDVYRYALMVLRNRDDAEDVAQTTFMKAYRAYQRGERPRHPRHWLITIAHNTCGTRIRDAKRRPREVALEEQLAAATPVVGDDIDVRELVRAFAALSFNQRAALVMRELEGRSYVEIAEVLELSTSAVETLLFRARRALREQLEGTLTCGEAERALSLQLDGRLPKGERPRLRAHLRECAECASLARSQRARRAALRSLGPLPLPASLASWGGGAAVGTGVAVKAAALLAAGIVAVGTTQQAADALHAAPSLESRQPAAAVKLDLAPRAAHAAGQFAGRVPATKHRRAPIASAVAQKSTAQAEPAAGGATVPNDATPPASAPTLPTIELPAVELPAVEPPPTPPVPVELPQVIVPTVPVPPVVLDVPVAVALP
jgi:RNA polymerase sigma-70 factor (ECF subfamily)